MSDTRKDAATAVHQYNEDARGGIVSSACYCEAHGMAEARKYHEDGERIGVLSAWEPRTDGVQVATFDLTYPNLPGHIRFVRSSIVEPCKVCEVLR